MKKILIIEDEEVLRQAYVAILNNEGYEIKAAKNGEEALKILKVFKPDLILLDILMPVMGGLEFLEHANLPDSLPETKVIAFSNLSDQRKLDEIFKRGIKHHVLKASLSPKQLSNLVNEELGQLTK